MSDADDYLLKRFPSNKTGRLETDLAYKCRLYWLRNNFPSSSEVAKACNTTYGNVSNYKLYYNWNEIKQELIKLREKERQEKYNQYQQETLEHLQNINKQRSGVLIFRLDFLLKEVGAVGGDGINPNLSRKDIKNYWDEIYTIIKLLSQIQKDRLRDACLPERINDKFPVEADINHDGIVSIINDKSREELDKEYEDTIKKYISERINPKE